MPIWSKNFRDWCQVLGDGGKVTGGASNPLSGLGQVLGRKQRTWTKATTRVGPFPDQEKKVQINSKRKNITGHTLDHGRRFRTKLKMGLGGPNEITSSTSPCSLFYFPLKIMDSLFYIFFMFNLPSSPRFHPFFFPCFAPPSVPINCTLSRSPISHA